MPMPVTVPSSMTRSEAVDVVVTAIMEDFVNSIGTNAPTEAREQMSAGIKMNAELAVDALVRVGALSED